MLDPTLPQDPDGRPREAGLSRSLDPGGPTTLVLGQSLLDLQAQEVADSSLPMLLAGRDGQVLAASSAVHQVLRREPGDRVLNPASEEELFRRAPKATTRVLRPSVLYAAIPATTFDGVAARLPTLRRS